MSVTTRDCSVLWHCEGSAGTTLLPFVGKSWLLCVALPRSFSSQHLSMGSISVVDTPGFQSPRQQRRERAATFEELCHNYVQERLQGLFYEKTFLWEMERYREVRSRAWEQLPAPGSAFVPRV